MFSMTRREVDSKHNWETRTRIGHYILYSHRIGNAGALDISLISPRPRVRFRIYFLHHNPIWLTYRGLISSRASDGVIMIWQMRHHCVIVVQATFALPLALSRAPIYNCSFSCIKGGIPISYWSNWTTIRTSIFRCNTGTFRGVIDTVCFPSREPRTLPSQHSKWIPTYSHS